VDAKAKQTPANLQAYEQLYFVRKAALDDLVAERLSAQEGEEARRHQGAVLEQELTSRSPR
jgi:hypothetical protein